MKHLASVLFDMATIALLIAGVFYGIEGAYNIGYISVWITTTIGLSSIVLAMHKADTDVKFLGALIKIKGVRRAYVIFIGIAELAILAWDGRFVIASLMAFLVVLVIGISDWASEKKAKLAAAVELEGGK